MHDVAGTRMCGNLICDFLMPALRQPKEESGGACLPQVAMYSAGYRKSENVTAR